MTPMGLQALAEVLGEAADYAASYRGQAACARLRDAAQILEVMAAEELAEVVS